jgi:hypothetical protein
VNATLLRMRIAMLWVATAVAASAALLLYFVVPGAVTDLANGEMEGEALTALPGWMFGGLIGVALLMSALMMIVADRWSYYVSVTVGVLMGLFVTFGVISHLSLGEFNGHVFMAMVGGVLVFLTAGLSWIELRHQTTAPKMPEELPADDAKPARHHVGSAA